MKLALLLNLMKGNLANFFDVLMKPNFEASCLKFHLSVFEVLSKISRIYKWYWKNVSFFVFNIICALETWCSNTEQEIVKAANLTLYNIK